MASASAVAAAMAGQALAGLQEGIDEESCNLMVNFLPSDATEDSLRDWFSGYGNVVQTKVIKDKQTGQSQGYGFVKFDSGVSAEKAIEGMNGFQSGNKRLKVALAQKPTQHHIYFAGLPADWDKETLLQLVQPVGGSIETRVLYDPATNVSKGVGFVVVDSKSKAEAIIRSYNGAVPEGGDRTFTVRLANNEKRKAMYNSFVHSVQARYNPLARAGQAPQASQARAAAAAASMFGFMPPQQRRLFGQSGNAYEGVCLFVYHLPHETTEDVLYHLFSPFGLVTNAKIMRDLSTGLSKGYGFVNMASLHEAQEAITGLNGFALGNKFLQVSQKK